MGERNLVAVGVGAVDVVETDGELRDDFQRALAGFILTRTEDFGVDGIAQGGDQAVDTGLHFFDNQTLRRRFRLGINLDFVTALAQQVDRFSDIASGKDAKMFVHEFPSASFRQSGKTETRKLARIRLREHRKYHTRRVDAPRSAADASSRAMRMYFRAVDRIPCPA